MSILPDSLPYGWPGPPGNTAAERLCALPTSRPSFFSHKRVVAKEISQAVKAVLKGVEEVHEALLKALERGEVSKKRKKTSSARKSEQASKRAKRASVSDTKAAFSVPLSHCVSRVEIALFFRGGGRGEAEEAA